MNTDRFRFDREACAQVAAFFLGSLTEIHNVPRDEALRRVTDALALAHDAFAKSRSGDVERPVLEHLDEDTRNLVEAAQAWLESPSGRPSKRAFQEVNKWIVRLATVLNEARSKQREQLREMRYRLAEADRYIFARGHERPDHACALCVPDGEILIEGFVCQFHLSRRRLKSCPRKNCVAGNDHVGECDVFVIPGDKTPPAEGA